MIVPIILDFLSEKEAQYLYEYYAGIRLEDNGVVIASEDYNKPIEYFRDKGRAECDQIYGIYGKNERNITQDDIYNTQLYYLDITAYKKDCKLSSKELNLFMVSKRYKPLEDFLDTVNNSVKAANKKIDAFLTFRQYKSVEVWAANNDIKVIYYDLSTYRNPVYKTLFYIDFKGHLNKVSFGERFKKFKKIIGEMCILSRKEILALMLNNSFEQSIEMLDYKPNKTSAVFFQDNIINWQISKLNCTNKKLLEKAVYEEGIENIVVRTGPVTEGEIINGVCIDKKKYAYETILDSEITYSRISNVSFETLLWGRKAYTSEDGLYSFIARKSLKDGFEGEIESFLSFATFGLYIPQEKLRDAEYLKWRCKEHSELEIYMDNLLYWLRTVGLNEEYLRLDGAKRLEKMLKVRGYSKEYIERLNKEVKK